MEEAYRRYLAILGPGMDAMNLETFAISGTMQTFLEYERRSVIAERAMTSELFSRFVLSYNATGRESFDKAWKKYLQQHKPRKPRAPPTLRTPLPPLPGLASGPGVIDSQGRYVGPAAKGGRKQGLFGLRRPRRGRNPLDR